MNTARKAVESRARKAPFTNWDDVPIVMDMPIAALIMGKCLDYLKRSATAGEFPAYKHGNEWRITKEDLQAYIEKLKAEKRPARVRGE